MRIDWDGPYDTLWIGVGIILGSPDTSNWWALPVAVLALIRWDGKEVRT